MNNKLLLLGLIVLFAGFVDAGLFDFRSVEPPFFGCSITGCTMQGNINMNNYAIYNASLVNPSLVEYDPVFTAENSTLWNAITSKLNITDQRYNDTLLIGIINTSIYVDLNDEINGRISNDSYLQGQINYLELNKLNITDQRYNDTQYILDALNNYYNKTESDAIYYPLTNPAGYINESFANSSYYPLNSNPAGYLNNNTLISLANGTWVKVTGDTMTGDLNMSNNSIWDVDVLSVHNITGRSPVYINSPVISFQDITANNFYGNINGQNGTIFGMTIVNGTITNMHVSDSASFNTSLLPDINNTWSLGEGPDKYWKSFYVAELFAGSITSPNVKRYYSDEKWIYKVPYSNTTDYIFYFNESLLNISINQSLQDMYALVNYLNESLNNETQARIGNDSYLQGQINYVYNETLQKLNITDQRYNDTTLIQIINATIKQPTGPYLSYDNTTFWINETHLNNTINNISKIKKRTYNMTCTAVNGDCNVTSTINITHVITEIKVSATTITTDYNFEMTEYPNTANIIDANRKRHKDVVWDIEKNYAINGQVNARIINAQVDELFTISVIYLTNGVE